MGGRGEEGEADPGEGGGIEGEGLVFERKEVIEAKEEEPGGGIGGGEGVEAAEGEGRDKGVEVLRGGGKGKHRAKGKGS